MTMQIKPLAGGFGAEVTGVDLANVSAADAKAVYQAYLDYSLLVVRDQTLSVDQHIEYSKQFGPLLMLGSSDGDKRAEIDTHSNVEPDGSIADPNSRGQKFKAGNQLWHTDMSFLPIPATASLLLCHEAVSQGGQTEYADMYSAYDALTDEKKAQLEPMIVEHSLWRSRTQKGLTEDDITPEMREAYPPALQPMVRTHAESGRKHLYLSGDAYRIVGMDDDAAVDLIEDLIDFSTHPRFTYAHPWRKGDLVIWDNRTTMHRGLAYDATKEKRVMHRTTAMQEKPTVVDGAIVVGA
jgi:alpha-ketoglutarate-dependent 2,4-dichlorophenoxyacetate dioxygenase